MLQCDELPIKKSESYKTVTHHSQILRWHLTTLISMSMGWYLIPLNIMVSSNAPTTNIASCLPKKRYRYILFHHGLWSLVSKSTVLLYFCLFNKLNQSLHKKYRFYACITYYKCNLWIHCNFLKLFSYLDHFHMRTC